MTKKTAYEKKIWSMIFLIFIFCFLFTKELPQGICLQPPRCPRTGHKDLLVHHRNHHSTESFLAALTVEEEVGLTVISPMNATNATFSLQIVEELSNRNLLWLIVILITLSVIVFLMLFRFEFLIY